MRGEADNNLPKDVADKVRKLFRLNHWREFDAGLEQACIEPGVRYANRFTCVRRTEMQYGARSLPRMGDQVLCVFVGGDPDNPLIIGRAHSGAKATAENHTRQRYKQLRMDDPPGQISAHLSSAHGQSQLNLGYLTHPRSNGSATPRGAGFELASNDSGTIRTAKSLLLTAWQRLDLFKTLGQYAATHQGTAGTRRRKRP